MKESRVRVLCGAGLLTPFPTHPGQPVYLLHLAFEALVATRAAFSVPATFYGSPSPLRPVLSHPCAWRLPAGSAVRRRTGAVRPWAPLEGRIPTQHVVLTAPKRLVKALGAVRPPQQLWRGRAWHSSRLGWDPRAHRGLALFSSGPGRGWGCGAEGCWDPVLRQTWPQPP